MREPADPPRAAAVVLAAGAGTRVGAEVNKVLLPLLGAPVLVHSVRVALAVPAVHRLLVVVRPGEREAVADAVAPHLGADELWLVEGGATRHDSEWAALQVLAPQVEDGSVDVVAVHDAARPLADVELWTRVIDAAAEHGGAVPVRRQPPLSRTDGSRAPDALVGVATPQAFRARELLAAYRSADADGFTGTDTASCLERYTSLRVRGVAGSARNLKVTFPEDLALAERLLSQDPR